MEKQQDKTEVKFLGSLVLLVGALGAFIALLYYFAPEGRTSSDTPTTSVYDTAAQQQQKRRRARSLPTDDATSAEETASPMTAEATASAPAKAASQKAKQDNSQLEKAVALIDAGNPDDALVILEQILKQNPRNERALIEISMVHLIDYRNAEAAVPWLERALKVNPSNRLVLAELVASYSEQDNVEGGLSFFQNLQESATRADSSYISLGIGQMLIADGRGDEAVTHLERAAAGLPHDPNILSGLASTYSLNGNSEKAIESYRKALAARRVAINKLPADDKNLPRQRQILIKDHLEIVREYYNQGDFDAALEEIEAASSYAPNHPRFANWRAIIARRRAG